MASLCTFTSWVATNAVVGAALVCETSATCAPRLVGVGVDDSQSVTLVSASLKELQLTSHSQQRRERESCKLQRTFVCITVS